MPDHILDPDGKTTITMRCPVCGNDCAIQVVYPKYQRWVAGKPAHHLWPDANLEAQQALLTGAHFLCFEGGF